MKFHPDNNLPGCMMPDGGKCCAGYQALLADWRRLQAAAQAEPESIAKLQREADRQRREIERMLEELTILLEPRAEKP
jgi:uncharacterized protein Yka (UPF0111/DUF47 family)